MSKIYDATLSSGTDPVYSDAIDLYNPKGFSVGIVWTGTLGATIILQLGIRIPPEDGGGILWFDTDETFPAVPEGTAGTSGQAWDYMNANLVRLKITRSAGSGTLKAYACWK